MIKVIILFEAKVAASIRSLIGRVKSLNLPDGASRYYAAELAHCLEAGALLAGLHVLFRKIKTNFQGIGMIGMREIPPFLSLSDFVLERNIHLFFMGKD